MFSPVSISKYSLQLLTTFPINLPLDFGESIEESDLFLPLKKYSVNPLLKVISGSGSKFISDFPIEAF